MAEENFGRKPPTLYKKCLKAYVDNLNYAVSTMDRVNYLRLLPPNVLADIYLKMSRVDLLKSMLHEQLVDLENFGRLLRFSSARQKLFKCVSAMSKSGKCLASQLQNKYIMRYRILPILKESNTSEIISKTSQQKFSEDFDMEAIDFGLRLGSFLSEAGWLSESINILSCVASRLEKLNQEYSTLLVRLDCLQRLLHSEALLCSFKSAEQTYKAILDIINNQVTIEKIPSNLLANVYTQISVLFFARSEYSDSHKWGVLALKQLKPTTPEKIVIDVLRQAAKSCVVKREFKRANMLISQAVRRARITFGKHHQIYADALLDYGFFLLNVDSIFQSVKIYREALDIKQQIFGNQNFHVAIAHEDLSYAFYVHEYSSGNFHCAREHVEKAISIMEELVPRNHLKLTSAKRVKALLLEEIALDKMVSHSGEEEGLLSESEKLHKSALELSLEAFGERNVQTAKHYGNLGRLYQTMNKFEEAERMHNKAIKIKSELLGPYDYEVGLSIGHLASLYNYHMKKYRDAERLYLRSIDISLRLFGKTYSGLEYDYLGLCHVYETLHEVEKYLEYAQILETWQMLRGQLDMNGLSKPLYPEHCDDSSVEEVTKKFFEMYADTLTAATVSSSQSIESQVETA